MAAIADLRSGTSKEENRFICRGVRLSPLSLKANKTCTTIELSMVPDLLIGHFKTLRFDVELFCPLQIFEVEFQHRRIALECAP